MVSDGGQGGVVCFYFCIYNFEECMLLFCVCVCVCKFLVGLHKDEISLNRFFLSSLFLDRSLYPVTIQEAQ